MTSIQAREAWLAVVRDVNDDPEWANRIELPVDPALLDALIEEASA